ncbi:Alkaline phosphatase synthesis transcriptional regulatory protein PhoP [Andreprevotia sp. IGB-42]|uniref:fused response regulator/phosphatase n=1 Tax=Andreprevotia sp. IGB-42 TaxID=2497473 RepID=UPI001357A84C|nr:fused response regulator/phosphatase [Andreprevotia sp. IGB-42]KAF0814449.1 Alkaline phosphatase synthesis transcriptional regulatory protein PhoP [Andreprevotia sp. IGB-42]
MKILVVDDTEAVLLLISRFVEALGHVAIAARNGVEALDTWRAERPDLVLMDMMMPVLSGPEAAVAIKREAGESWVPIVFVTGVGEENRLAEAIEQGADDYITKPVNFRVLEAKLKAFNRTLELNRKVREQSAKLADYYDRTEEEKRVVRHLMEQMVNAERLYDPQLEYWLSPAESLSGDLIAAARTPGQALHLMLADGIGHGLTAALNVLPLTQPFYSMTEKGYAISDILIEMNDKVRQVLPVGRFVAVVLISIDEAAGCIEVWNGGMPTVHVIDAQGVVRKIWKSAHLPLGIVPTPSIELMTERYYFHEPGTLLAFSDGLIEARNPDGEAYGQERLLQELANSPPVERLASFQTRLADHLQGQPHHDDISIVLASFGANVDAQAAEQQRDGEPGWPELAALAHTNDCAWRYSLVLGAEELKYINTVPFMMTFINEVAALKHSQSDVFLILTELFVNALDHGVLGVPSSIKHEEDGMEQYLLARSRSLAALRDARIEIDLAGLVVGGRDVLRIGVRDSGPGFDWQRVLARPLDVTTPCGRGIALVRALCISVQYFGNGSDVVAYYLPHADPAVEV